MNAPLLRVVDVERHFHVRRSFSPGHTLKAVDRVSFEIAEGSCFCIVGESGCGKTTTANIVLGLDAPTGGRIEWRGSDIAGMARKERDAFRRSTNAVFQDPMGSLDPRMRIGQSVAEPLRRTRGLSKSDIEARVAESLRAVGMAPDYARRFPHEFSGGQRQRIAIARALIAQPSLIVLDEPVASLDLSIQAQVMNLLKRLRQETGVAFLMISHNLATVRFLADDVGVMYLGRVVEQGPAREVFSHPRHPYTRALIEAARMTEGGAASAIPISGELPSPFAAPDGCRFHPRCQHVQERCRTTEPVLVARGGHPVACHRADEFVEATS